MQRPERADAGGEYFPVALDLRGRRCLVVGAGSVARRRVRSLLDAGAHVTVVAPGAVSMPGATVRSRGFTAEDVEGAAFVTAATDDAGVNASVALAARQHGILVNVADDAELSDVIIPAVVRRGPLSVAVTTGGASPALARRLKERLAAELGSEWGELATLLGELRAAWVARSAGLTPKTRAGAWERVLDLHLELLLARGEIALARRLAEEVLDDALTGSGAPDAAAGVQGE